VRRAYPLVYTVQNTTNPFTRRWGKSERDQQERNDEELRTQFMAWQTTQYTIDSFSHCITRGYVIIVSLTPHPFIHSFINTSHIHYTFTILTIPRIIISNHICQSSPRGIKSEWTGQARPGQATQSTNNTKINRTTLIIGIYIVFSFFITKVLHI
jgi:hypothetical protein